MTYLPQMAGLAVQNFVSAAVGIAVVVALIRIGHHRQRPHRQLLDRPVLLRVLLPLAAGGDRC